MESLPTTAECGAPAVAASPPWLCRDPAVPRGVPLTRMSRGGFSGVLRHAWLQLGGTEIFLWDRVPYVPAKSLVPAPATLAASGPHWGLLSPPPSRGGRSPPWALGAVYLPPGSPAMPCATLAWGTWSGGAVGGTGTPAAVWHPDPLLFLLPASGAGRAVFVVRGPEWTGRMGSSWRGEPGRGVSGVSPTFPPGGVMGTV